jgi:DNA-directed RNA polymerase subunit M/transcription elongation factor TFIIS
VSQKGRNSDPHDTIRLLKSKLKSVERENQRLRKLTKNVERDEEEKVEEAEIVLAKTYKVEPTGKPRCDRCLSDDINVITLQVKDQEKVILRCRNCGQHKKAPKK